jgi:hypothetical protein
VLVVGGWRCSVAQFGQRIAKEGELCDSSGDRMREMRKVSKIPSTGWLSAGMIGVVWSSW